MEAPSSLSVTLPSLEATRRVGRTLGAALPREAIVLCSGGMGSGKTTLIKAICEGLGIRRETVISPTYTLVNIYPGRWPVYHVDLYRLGRPEELLELDRSDWINAEGPTLIEWPEVALPLLGGEAVLSAALALAGPDREQRRLTLSGDAERYGAVFRAVREAEPAGGGEPRA